MRMSDQELYCKIIMLLAIAIPLFSLSRRWNVILVTRLTTEPILGSDVTIGHTMLAHLRLHVRVRRCVQMRSDLDSKPLFMWKKSPVETRYRYSARGRIDGTVSVAQLATIRQARRLLLRPMPKSKSDLAKA